MLHGVHEDYLTPDGRTIYILALAADRAPQRDRKRDCLDDGNGLDYWLRTISRFAGPSAPVIVAITKCDPYAPGVRRRIDEPLDATDNRPVCQWSPTELSERTDSAVSSIVDGCSATSAMNSVEPIRTAIEAALDNLAALREKRVPRELMPLIHRVTDEWGSRSGVTVDEFRDWCRAADIESPELQDACLRILSDLGILFFYGRTAQEQRQMRESEDRRKLWLQTLPEGQRRRVLREREPVLDEFVLNPDWIKWPLYRVTRESERASKRGFITRAEIEDAICQGNAELQRSRNTFCVPERGAEIVFAVLRQTELCLWVESEGEYLFPRGLPADGLNLIPEWAKKGGQGYDAAKHGSIRWGFFSKSSFQRLIVRNYHLASERRCWRYGIVIRSGHCEAVVVAEPDDNRVDIHLHGGSNAEQRRIYQSLKSFAEVYIGDPMEEQAPHWNESSAKAEIHASSADYRESVSSESIESGFAAANAVRKCKLRVDLEKRLIYVGIKAYPQSSALACEIVQRLIDADGGIVPADKLLEDIGKTATADRCKEALAKLSPEVRRLIGGRAGQGGGRFLMPKAFGG